MSCVARAYRIRLAEAAACRLLALCLAPSAWAADSNGDERDEPARPSVYLDYRMTLTALPAGLLAFGFRGLPNLQLSSEASRTALFDFPLTIDITDTLSLYGGPTTSSSSTTSTSWRQMTLDSWHVGVQADVYQQNGAWFPTLTLQSTLTRSIPETLLSATSNTSVAEFGYAFDEDETRGLLAGVQYTSTHFNSNLPRVRPGIVGYVGGYHQWDNNWKLTGRAGVQSFGGAELLTIMPVKPFTKPILRFDLDKQDDCCGRIFGMTAEVAWTPKPVFSLTLRAPMYFVRN